MLSFDNETNRVWRRTTVGFLIISCLIAVVAYAGAKSVRPVQPYDETVVVDLAVDEGPVTHRGSGFLFIDGISENNSDLALLFPLKPKFFRLGAEVAFDVYDRIQSLGATIEIVISDGPEDGKWPGENGDWSRWENRLREYVNRAKANGQTFRWDLWNEPNFDGFWGASQSQFFETWARGVRIIRSLDPQATIVGPSISWYDEHYLDDFLTYALNNNVLPDVLTWHELDPRGGVEITTHVKNARNMLAQKGISLQRFELNEIIPKPRQFEPGFVAASFAEIEENNIEFSAKACWEDTGGSNCHARAIDGLVTSNGGKRAVWWTYKTYADLSGRMVQLSESNTIKGVASRDATQGTSNILVGNPTSSTKDILIRLRGISTIVPSGGQVRVLAKRIPDSGQAELSSPITVVDEQYAITGNDLVVLLPDFKGGEAFAITVQKVEVRKEALAPPCV